jgi:mRNA interferase HicA
MSEDKIMRGNEFIKKIQKLAKKRGISARVDSKRGKGSHVTLYFGNRLTIVRNPKDELKTGTVKGMLFQLGITQDDFNEV